MAGPCSASGSGSVPTYMPPFISGRYYGVNGQTAAAAAWAVAVTKLYAKPITIFREGTFTGCAARITANAAAGGRATMGVYECDEFGYPGALLAQGTAIETDVGAVPRTQDFPFASPLILTPGTYFIALNTGVQAATFTVAGFATVQGFAPFGLDDDLSPLGGFYEADEAYADALTDPYPAGVVPSNGGGANYQAVALFLKAQ